MSDGSGDTAVIVSPPTPSDKSEKPARSSAGGDLHAWTRVH